MTTTSGTINAKLSAARQVMLAQRAAQGLNAFGQTPAQAKTNGQFGMHNRWHIQRGKPNPACPFCQGDA